jgi:TonB-dependent receptor
MFRYSVTASVFALVFAGQPVWAQAASGSDHELPAKPVATGSQGMTSGTPGVEAGTAPTSIDQAGATTGTAGASQEGAVTAPETGRDEIVVTGVRQSLATAQNIKRNADTVVDAITAQDIGALPDRSVNEALQRVPGVAISRFAAPTDSQHFSVQGSGVVIRGLSYVRGEFNGRDTFAVGGGREIGFSDVPSELVGSIEVFKNLTADLIEGGISGTVNINARKPFDSDKNLVYLSAGMGIGDIAERGSPFVVGLVSRQWDVGGGRLGILASGTYSQIQSRTQSIYFSGWLPRQNDDRNGNGQEDPGETRTINAGTGYSSQIFDRYPVPTGMDRVYTPLGPGFRDQRIDRERIGISAAAQYENADRTLLVTAQYLRADSKEVNLDNTIEGANWYGDITAVIPVGGSTPTYDENGLLMTGTLGRNQSPAGWIDSQYRDPLPQFIGNSYGLGLTNRTFRSHAITQDAALNVKWDANDRLHLNLDGQYVHSTSEGYDATIDGNSFSQIAFDRTSSIPNISFVTPGFDASTYFTRPASIFLNNASVNRADNDGEEWAFRGDLQYDVSDDNFLRKVRVGGRYAKRSQTVRTNDYNNWGSLSANWAFPNGAVSIGSVPNEQRQFPDFFRGQTASPPPALYLPDSLITNDARLMEVLRGVVRQGGVGSYVPLQDRTNTDGGPLVNGYFRNNEIYRNTEETQSAYVRADFGADSLGGGGMSLSGNIGVRFVHTRDVAFGGITFPQSNTVFQPDVGGTNPDGTARPPRFTTLPEFCTYVAANPGQFQPTPPICTIPINEALGAIAFANGASVSDVARQSYDKWLPALNVRLDITPKLLMRLAMSKAISRPNFGDLRNFLGISPAGGNRAGAYGFSLNGSNPFLRPIDAKQVDLTAEWYFAKVGQLTVAGFYKELDNIIVNNSPFLRTLTNNNQTYTVVGNGPVNAEGTGKVYGGEVSYQQTYDFLPGPLAGLGTQVTYTYVKTSGIPNSPPANSPNDGNRPVLDVVGLYDNLPLAGLSTHNFNISPFFDRGGIYARLAYSWRSKFLLNNRDCCFPFLPIYALPAGQLDASIFLTVNPNFKIGIEAQNLTDTTTKTAFLMNSSGLEAPRTYFKADRQFTLSTRLTF